MSLQSEYEVLLGMPQEKVGEVAKKILELAKENGVVASAAKRIALAIKNKVSFQTLITDPLISSNRAKFDKFILEAISQSIMNPQVLAHQYGEQDSSNVDLNESMLQKGENPSLGGRKSRKHKRKHRKTRKLKLRKDRPIFAEELDKPIAGGKKHRK
jgi:hypothetical protein